MNWPWSVNQLLPKSSNSLSWWLRLSLKHSKASGLPNEPNGGRSFGFYGNCSQVIGSDDCEVWIGSGPFSDPLRTSAATMQPRKRQNCGAEAHHRAAFQSIGQLGLVAMTEESSNLSGPNLTGVHTTMNQDSRPNSQSLPFNGIEPGRSNIARFSFSDGVAPDANWNELSSALQHPASNPVRSSTNGSYAYGGDQNRNRYKRKSSMDTFPGSFLHTTSQGMVENNYLRFTQGPGLCRSDLPFDSVCDDSRVGRNWQDAYYFRNSATSVNRYDGLSTTLTRENYYCPSMVQNERALLAPRRMLPTSNTVNELACNLDIGLPETLLSRQHNFLAAAGSWHTNSTYLGEGSNQLGFSETMRNFHSSYDENHLRRGQVSDMMDISSVDTRPHQLPHDMMDISSVDTRPHQLPHRAIRPAHLQEFTSQSSHLSHHQATNPYAYVGTVNMQPLPIPAAQPSSRYNNNHTLVFPPPGLATTMSGTASGLQAAFGDLSSGSMPGQYLPRYNDTSRALYLRRVAFRGSRVLPSDGVHRHRFSASHHELLNQSLSYEWVDDQDEHSDMRLDVDNMSYEELLALEETIGNANTGLTEDDIHKCLKSSTHACTEAKSGVYSQESNTKCSICQEEYAEGDQLGELKCGHAYHTDCIKQWLLLKNQCPICKAAAC